MMSELASASPQVLTQSDQQLVLIADDDEVILGLVIYRLEHSGYRVLAAHDGEDALRLALAERPALAVIDVMMPKLDGYELTRALRRRYETRHIPIILLTARAQEVDVRRGREAGADDYLPKPFSPEELRSRVAALLARR
jgi:DNA-binding response OmpR family regulator